MSYKFTHARIGAELERHKGKTNEATSIVSEETGEISYARPGKNEHQLCRIRKATE